MVEDVLKAKRLDGALAALGRIAAASFADGRQRQLLRDRLAELEVPAQVIWGEADRILPAAHAEGLPAAIAVHRLPATGHLAHMERAAEVNARIRELLVAA
jgi:pyruvate dehydrogenase E2 component (dihydrolipoamide acetyltransferase)